MADPACQSVPKKAISVEEDQVEKTLPPLRRTPGYTSQLDVTQRKDKSCPVWIRQLSTVTHPTDIIKGLQENYDRHMKHDSKDPDNQTIHRRDRTNILNPQASKPGYSTIDTVVNPRREKQRQEFVNRGGLYWLLSLFSQHADQPEVLKEALVWLTYLSKDFIHRFPSDYGFRDVTTAMCDHPKALRDRYCTYLSSLDKHRNEKGESKLVLAILSQSSLQTVYDHLVDVLVKQDISLSVTWLQTELCKALAKRPSQDQKYSSVVRLALAELDKVAKSQRSIPSRDEVLEKRVISFSALVQSWPLKSEPIEITVNHLKLGVAAAYKVGYVHQLENEGAFEPPWDERKNFALQIHGICAENLFAADSVLVGGKSDPFVVMKMYEVPREDRLGYGQRYQGEGCTWKSSVISKTLFPLWCEKEDSVLEKLGASPYKKVSGVALPQWQVKVRDIYVVVNFYDKDMVGSDYLGCAKIELKVLFWLWLYFKRQPFTVQLNIAAKEYRDDCLALKKEHVDLMNAYNRYAAQTATCTLHLSFSILNELGIYMDSIHTS